MESPRSKPLLARLFGSADPGSALADAHDFLQQRVTLYTKLLFCYFAVSTAAAAARILWFEVSDGMREFRANALWFTGALTVLTAVLAWDWWFLSRARRSLGALHVLESGGTVCGCTFLALMMPFLPSGVPEIVVLFPIILALVIRAALVPSTPVRTLVVGALSTMGLALLIRQRGSDFGPEASLFARHMWIGVAVWGVIFSLSTAIVSRVIYGLQRTARQAMQLGNYTLEKKIGEGGMGAVYLAHHAMLRRPTAVKLLPREKAGEQAIARFEREVQNSSRLTHPNTVQIYDFGRTPEGIFYYAMEYLEGINLAELVELEGPQPPGRVIHILAQVAHALAEAHDIGLIHRDIKPANIVLCNRGGVADMAKVVDFGLVKNLGAPRELDMTADDTVTGTPLYMSPEAFSAPDRVDGRADLYSLGAVGFYLLTGEHVFDGSNAVTVAGHHLHSRPDRPSERLGRELPGDLEAVVLRALAKNPSDRYDHALALRRALLGCADARSWDLAEAATWWARRGGEIASYYSSKCQDLEMGMANTIAVDLGRRAGG